MEWMLTVRCFPRPARHSAVPRPPPCMLRAPQSLLPPPASRGPQPAPRTVCPACDPRQFAFAFNQPLDWDTSRVTNMRHMFDDGGSDVRCYPRPARGRRPVPLSPHTPHALSLRLGRNTPSPPPTSLASAASGRTPPPSSPLAMAQAVLGDGPRIPAPEALTEVCVWPEQSPWRLPVPQPATCAWRPHLHRRERGA